MLAFLHPVGFAFIDENQLALADQDVSFLCVQQFSGKPGHAVPDFDFRGAVDKRHHHVALVDVPEGLDHIGDDVVRLVVGHRDNAGQIMLHARGIHAIGRFFPFERPIHGVEPAGFHGRPVSLFDVDPVGLRDQGLVFTDLE